MAVKKIIFGFGLFLFLGFGTVQLQAQQAVVPAGGNASGNSGSVSYTVGQVFYQTIDGPSAYATEGVQQPYEIYNLTSVENLELTLEVSIFPNPTSDYLIIELDESVDRSMNYAVFDVSGKQVDNQLLSGIRTAIPTAGLSSGTYFIAIFREGEKINTFKVVKQ
nr:T9SS type A sorting domain-containing protein [Saprospiraceae bacterium]